MLRQLYGKLLFKLKEKEVKEAIARNLREKTTNFSVEDLERLKRIYEAEQPTEISKASVEELKKIIEQRKKLQSLTKPC